MYRVDAMNILAFDTCLDACSAAVRSVSAGTLAAACEPMATGQAERLVPMISEVMADAGVSFADIGRIAVTVGPGTFTGTRIAIAAARALALAADVPVVTASSLAVIAEQAVGHLAEVPRAEAIAVALDARRGQIYWQRFALRGGLAPLCEPQVLSPELAALQIADTPCLIAGSGAGLVDGYGPGQHAVIEAMRLPLAEDLAAMAVHLQPVASPRPLYLRPADAKPQVGKSIARVST